MPENTTHPEQPTDGGEKYRAVADRHCTDWRAFGLQPHRVENLFSSKDLQFVEKVRDIVGLYTNPLIMQDRAVRR